MRLPSASLTRLAAAGNPFAALAMAPGAAAAAPLYGIGVDIAHIPRFQRIYERHGMQFLRKCLHPTEIKQIQALAAPSGFKAADAADAVDAAAPPAVLTFLASRWAAKEALIKAAGSRLLFPEMLVSRDSSVGAADPRARIVLSGAALQWSAAQGVESEPLLALSHDGEYAVAFVAVQRKI